jgi:hypothetical protein
VTVAKLLGAMLWTRLDTPGHDACVLEDTGEGFTIEGTAVYRYQGAPAHLRYRVACTRAWRTVSGEVRGTIGRSSMTWLVSRAKTGAWILNGDLALPPGDCIDLDLGITPATNLLQIRRLALGVGQQADCPVVWLDAAAGRLRVLAQTYERRAETGYWYEAPRVGYAAMLDVSELGFVREYPGLWRAEA